MELRYGLKDGCAAMTLEQVGMVYRVTLERIRQLQEDTEGELKANADLQILTRYL